MKNSKNCSKIAKKFLFFPLFGKESFLNQTLGPKKSFLNQTTYVLKNQLQQQSFLNRDSFLNQAFLNRDSTVLQKWNEWRIEKNLYLLNPLFFTFHFRWQLLFPGLSLYLWWYLLLFVANIVKKNCRKNMPLKQPKPSVNGPKKLLSNVSKLRIALFQV